MAPQIFLQNDKFGVFQAFLYSKKSLFIYRKYTNKDFLDFSID
jgi:hypothetical protein